uniref:Ty3-gypsy retroelement transposase n=1 Tax=Cucumis melo subsp. melo TaxID=412675 RepID=E5GB27_CUCME|nr:ty3-gypsy retroelement transposase [Cucumis melo subsp. melo]
MKVKGKVKNEDVVVLIDCWATHNFISEKLVSDLNLPLKSTSSYKVILGLGVAIKGKGICGKVEVLLGDWKVVDSLLPLELGGVDCEGRNVIIRGDPSLTKKGVSLKSIVKSWVGEDQGFLVECQAIKGNVAMEELYKEESELTVDNAISPLLRKFEDVFEWLETLPPKRGIEHHIHLKQGTNPVDVRPYHYAYQQKEEMERVFDEWNGANVFSKINLKAGYHQIRMNQEDVEKMVFRTHEGHYEFLVMPFGLTNAPSTFRALMNAVFRPYMRSHSKELEEHMQHLELVLEILRANGLYANLAKCSFAKERVGYLGHIISEKGVEVDPEKIRAIKEWPTPTTCESTAGPLTQLLKNGAFKWNEEANESFEKLKTAMMTLPVLAMPDFNLPFEIETDASGYGIGAVLTQAKSLKFSLEQRVIQPQYQKWIVKLLGYSFEEITGPALIDLAIIQEVENDPRLKEIKSIVEQHPDDIPNFTIHKGVLQFKGSKIAHPLEIPDTIWTDISMDFIDGLPKLARYEVIFVVVDRMNLLASPFPSGIWKVTTPLFYYWGHENTQFGIRPAAERQRHSFEKMKKNANLKRRANDFQVGDMVFLKLRPYRQALGDHTQVQPIEPYLTETHEWMTQPEEVYGYRKNPSTLDWEVLISWKGLPHTKPLGKFVMTSSNSSLTNLEDKVDLVEESSVKPPVLFTYDINIEIRGSWPVRWREMRD